MIYLLSPPEPSISTDSRIYVDSLISFLIGWLGCDLGGDKKRLLKFP